MLNLTGSMHTYGRYDMKYTRLPTQFSSIKNQSQSHSWHISLAWTCCSFPTRISSELSTRRRRYLFCGTLPYTCQAESQKYTLLTSWRKISTKFMLVVTYYRFTAKYGSVYHSIHHGYKGAYVWYIFAYLDVRYVPKCKHSDRE